MPPLIAFAGALGGLAVVRWAYRTAMRINRELEEARLARVAEVSQNAAKFRPCGAIPTPAPTGRGEAAPNTPSWPGIAFRRTASLPLRL